MKFIDGELVDPEVFPGKCSDIVSPQSSVCPKASFLLDMPRTQRHPTGILTRMPPQLTSAEQPHALKPLHS